MVTVTGNITSATTDSGSGIPAFLLASISYIGSLSSKRKAERR